ncbi:hypothetical protein BDA96_05G110900 [Sorghum bicolor]|uniref:Uncharacterized protein n=2 Tax=Sorghum bicolor TaxID=4558 RepID=A0A921QZ84_SORBI|nr:hypothetical protein BDA96_05G110900 [Sorghum bicolor]OQU83295.1 hypothetical protein SORBI_3005G106101 [Sorghum bicolor]
MTIPVGNPAPSEAQHRVLKEPLLWRSARTNFTRPSGICQRGQRNQSGRPDVHHTTRIPTSAVYCFAERKGVKSDNVSEGNCFWHCCFCISDWFFDFSTPSSRGVALYDFLFKGVSFIVS